MSRVIITYRQCRAGRELIGWKQKDLCAASGITQSTIADFERGARQIKVSTLEKIIDAFKDKGVTFENEGELIGIRYEASAKAED